MKVGIIGLGYVGGAIAWAHQPQTVIMRDPKLKDSAELSDFVDCDVIYVCVPSPSTEDGHCDSSILESTLKELLFVLINKQIPIICKTTAPPSVYARLQKEYPKFKETVSIAKKPKTEKGGIINNTLYVTFAMIIFGLAFYYYKNMKSVDEEVF